LELYPEYYDCLVYRGKLQLKKENYYHALKDFSEAIKINRSKGFAYIGKGMCEKELGHLEEAIETLTTGANTDMGHVCIEKRGIVYFEKGEYDLALRDLEHCTQL
jgi:tetratricopeptide (TPR) repeat protein